MKHINVSLFVPHMGCPHSCIFCDQRAISGSGAGITREEIISACETAKKTPHEKENSEIAFFGGSFTAISRNIQKMCLETAAKYLKDDFSGIRVSTRPDCIDEEELDFLKSYGVTSIELGAQSMANDVLLKNERGHTPEDTVRASALIKDFGFSLGLQMMTGLYGSSDEKDVFTAEEFIKLKPDTVRIYPTAVLSGTKLCSLYRSGDYSPPELQNSVSLCAKLIKLFYDNNINVIRVGLHSGGNVEESFVAGVYHPAFRELCESEIYKTAVFEELKNKPQGNYTVFVSPGEVSKAAGQKKNNKIFFNNIGYTIKIRESEKAEKYRPQVTTE
ncbi:MAG: radical SAM protein [Oscillospiraceae bacterium]|nr:radical SAM protein [Oscillospiraceae bacterium]